jgi:hypothetical protein
MANAQMPKDTILFTSVDKNKPGIGYSYEYFKGNFVTPSPDYQKIYYKAGSSRDTWIDYKKTIQLKPGNRAEMIAAALADPNFLIDFRDIPASYVYDLDGDDTIRQYYTPYDGYYDHEMWLRRVDRELNLTAINEETLTPETDRSQYIIYHWDADDLYVDFPAQTAGIDNAIISINMLFLEYVKVHAHRIVYRNLKPNIGKHFGWDENDGRNTYDFRFNVYKWQDLAKAAPISPVGKAGSSNYFIMPVEMETNAFIFWNGVSYTYDIAPGDDTYIRIKGINANTFDSTKYNEIKVVRMTPIVDNMEVHRYVHCGINNKYANSVDFLLPVCDSLITYQGVDHEYVVEDDNAIRYIDSSFSLSGDVTYVAEVLSVNFIRV